MSDSDSNPDKAESPFAELLKEIASCPSNEAQPHLQKWRDRLNEIWPGEPTNDQFWSLLVKALPLPADTTSSGDHKGFDLLLIRNPESFRAVDAFLCDCGYARLNQYSWTNHDSEVAYQFVAGCVNLATIAKQFDLTEVSGSFISSLQSAVSSHGGALLWIAGHSPQLFEKTAQGFRFAGVIELQTNRGNVENNTLLRFLKNHVKKLDGFQFDLIEFITGYDRAMILRILVPELLKERQSRSEAKEFWLEDASISGHIGSTVRETDWYEDKVAVLRIWPHYLVPSDAFNFCWHILFWSPKDKQFGTTLEERFTTLSNLLVAPFPVRRLETGAHRQRQTSHNWRKWFLDLFKAVGGLVEGDRWHRSPEEEWIRQNEVVELLAAEPGHLKPVVWGILNEGKGHWDTLDSIILGLPTGPAIECLEEYVNDHRDTCDEFFHAKRLIAHLRGEVPVLHQAIGPSGLLGAVENLIQASRTKLPDLRARTWLGDAGIESLWLGAIQKGITEFETYLTSHYGHDEHEHVAVLADKMATCLNATNSTVSQWLQQKHSVPLFINASVRRFAKTAPDDFPQEGGAAGLQADIGFLLDCDVPGMMKTRRITLVQAKKLKQVKKPDRWDAGFHFKGKEETQLKRLIQQSQHAHYLFFIHPELGFPSLLLPAMTVQDSCNSNGARQVALPVVRNGGMPIPEFMLYGIIGLWTGDEDTNLIRECQRGAEIGQGPRLIIEVRISSEGRGH